KPDIAADEPVHRLAGSEVTQCRLDSPGLVFRLSKGEPRGEPSVITRRRPQHGRLGLLLRPRLFNQRTSCLRHVLLDLGTALRPSSAIQTIELESGRPRPIPPDSADLVDRCEQRLISGLC